MGPSATEAYSLARNERCGVNLYNGQNLRVCKSCDVVYSNAVSSLFYSCSLYHQNPIYLVLIYFVLSSQILKNNFHKIENKIP